MEIKQIFVYFLQWKPFCATVSTPQTNYIAIVAPYKPKEMKFSALPKVGAAIPGIAGITQGFVTHTTSGIFPIDSLRSTWDHLSAQSLYLVIEGNDKDKGNKVMYVESNGIRVSPKTLITANVSNGKYDLEVHGEL